ncbi:TonB-denpendent receptor [Sphingobium sp. C100]|uniref:TonB-dependent receptor n=1 Tax=Sphingobium sp. C100 TaxID=1207055 RepID=UPI0003D67794|nr:TonB-dependent receptor [Sphingobium sp. C100]ETI58614.1 TonB-denpendent receptor [Sphingobium sp. C100]
MKSFLITSSVIAILCAGAAPAWAQGQQPGDADAAVAQDGFDQIIVTGRAGTGERTKAETSYSVTTIDEEKLRLQAPTSVTEALKSVPGFWVEASGGEASGNVRARGVPVDGFGSVQLLEDGIPVQHDPALGYLNADQAFRLDETIDRIEVVRGGPASLFYSNAPAGAINFIPRQVGDQAEGLVKFTLGADNFYRTDFWVGAPVGDWKVALGGFYRSGDGVRDPGFTGNRGGQVRATISREWENAKFSFDVKRLDDIVAFYTGIPMRTSEDGKIRAVPGFSGHSGTVAGPETERIKMIQGDGSIYDFDNSVGTQVKRTQLTSKFEIEPFDGWNISNTSRYNDTKTQRNGVYPNALQSASALLQQNAGLLAQAPDAAALQLRYVTTPGQIYDTANQNGNGLVIVGGLRGITMPVKEFMSDTRIAHRFDMGSTTHDITFGYYFAHIDEDFSRYSSTALLDVQDNARLLNLVAVDAAGNVVKTYSDNGIYRYGYEWEDAHGEQTTHALYISDEWQITPKLRIDGGVRWETMRARGTVGLKKTVNLGTPATSSIITGSGVYANYNDNFSHATVTAGANYQFSPNAGVFARYTYANRLPSLGNYITNASAKPIVQTMHLGEIGAKYTSPLIDLYATGFWTKYNDVAFTNYRFDLNNGASVTEALFANTETFGLELEGTVRPTPWFDMSASATLQDPRYKGLVYTDSAGKVNDYDGNRLIRVPTVSLRFVPGVNLFDNRLRVQASYEYEGPRYVDTANSVRLPGYATINLSARAQISDRISLYGYVDNLNNSLGLTEGNPRAGELQNGDAGANSFIARPLIGRNFRAALMYKF